MAGKKYTLKSNLSLFLRVQSVCAGGIYQGYVLTEMLFTGMYILSMNGIQIFEESQNEKQLTEQTRLLCLLIGPIFCVSGFIISYFIPLFTAKIERRQCMIISDIIFITATILTQIPSLYVFVIARFLMGATCGIDLIVTPLYIREISPDHISSKTESLFQANISLGILLAFFNQIPMENFTDNDQEIGNYWHFIFLFPAIFSIIRLLSLVFIYKKDTPYYYYRKKQLIQGREALELIYQDKCILELEQQYLVPGSFDINEIQTELQIGSCQDVESSEQANNFNSLVSEEINIIQDYGKSYKNRLRVGILINFCQEMSGGTAVIGLSGSVIGLLTDNPEMERCLILGSYVFNLFVSTLGVAFDRKLARKKYLVGGFLLCSICQFIMAIISSCFNNLKENLTLQFTFFMFLLFFYASFNFTIGPVTVILTSDILKDRGFSYSIMANWLGHFFSFVLLVNPYQYINHIIYGFFGFLGFLFSMKYIVETRWFNFSNLQEIYKDIQKNQQQNLKVKPTNEKTTIQQNLLQNSDQIQ
ncbi:MFS transporter (macronuclear) [Tetrahymena thermophila SB210]|uniref:MFS transporter n=1 Tax=Tetrahymena thermophila (strain SB210) TaxID=312017 RepID=Q22B18_TETTS|nr:MFS transporter [Tetrahymena thermophila SB210]EAR82490.1 MFS transporter [Tetrahymena thermophila SB210]|eukprot:XP_001030153.1 MFS transporter [Tetrahymena thermophila SB210]